MSNNQRGTASNETVWLTLFPFTLKDRVKSWLENLTLLSISTWAELQALFLKKFFRTRKTIYLKKLISTFTTREGERFQQCWDKFMDAVNACPHHGFEKITLANFSYDELTLSMKQLLESMCNRSFLHMLDNEAL